MNAVGHDIFFAQGQYNPHSYEGKKLMAHELAHTIQTGSVQRKIHRKSNEQPVQKRMIINLDFLQVLELREQLNWLKKFLSE